MFLNRFCVIVVLTIYFRITIAAFNPEKKFICQSGKLLEVNRVCDGTLDCDDGSDELRDLCYHVICPQMQFRCHYGACVDREKHCNGIMDCTDGSDESQCDNGFNSCASNEYRCLSGQCISSSLICNSNNDCLDGSDESYIICDNQNCPLNSFRCKYGGCVDSKSQCDGFPDCIDASDESQQLCNEINNYSNGSVKCPALKSYHIQIQCENQHGIVPCDSPMIPGSTATYSCKKHYVPINKKHEFNHKTVCQRDGIWSRDLLKCKPDCGLLKSAMPLVVNGWHVNTIIPWHALLYALHNGKWKYWCGGTLVSEAAILTAAHCTWNIDVKNIKVALGKIVNEFKDDDPNFFSVKRIVNHPFYLDKDGNYGSDISILELDGTVLFNDEIRPVCLDWELDDITSHLSDESLGLAMGMGFTENNTNSEILQGTKLPVVANTKCIQSHDTDFRKYITFTTFCAGWGNGTGVCNGDSGGGLVFPIKQTDRWCLQGIVSLSPRQPSTSHCDPHSYTIFTKVGIYVQWIKNIISIIEKVHNYTVIEYEPIL